MMIFDIWKGVFEHHVSYLRSIPRYCGPEEIHDRASFDCSYLGNEMAGSVQKSIDT